MGWLEDSWKGVKSAIGGAGEAIDPTSSLDWQERGENLVRGGLAIGTSGLSEAARAGYGSAKEAFQGFTDVKPSDYGSVNAATENMRGSQNWLGQMMQENRYREAPQMEAPTNMVRAGVRNVYSPELGRAPTASPTNISPEAIELQRQAALGLAPSQATGMLQQGISQAGQLGMALAGARGGYSPAAVRGAQREMSAAAQNAAAQASQIRAQEMAAARGQFADISAQQAQLAQQAKMFNASQQGQFALTEAENSLKAQLANQGVDLDVMKTNAARGDAASIANLQAQIQAMGMSDAMQLAYISSILGIDEQILAAEMAKVGIDQQRYIMDQQTRMDMLKSGIKAAGDLGASSATAGGGGSGGTGGDTAKQLATAAAGA